MSRVNATVPPEAIRIEDEVWQDAFARREPARDRRRLRAIEGGAVRSAAEAPAQPRARVPTAPPRPVAEPTRGVPAAPTRAPGSAPRHGREATGEPHPARESETPARRTVRIQGRGAERNLPLPDPSRQRTQRRAYERAGFRPDRIAMWAVLLGFLLVFVAIVSAHS